MSVETKTKIRWDGPPQQVCYPLSQHGYKAVLTPGEIYELPKEFAASLLRSSRHWAPVAESGPARRRTDLKTLPATGRRSRLTARSRATRSTKPAA